MEKSNVTKIVAGSHGGAVGGAGALRVALVTGASRGLGAEVAQALAREGFLVLVGARDEGRGEETARSIASRGGSARVLPLDVTDALSIARAVEDVERREGRLDVLVNNAGVMLDGAWQGNTAATGNEEILRATFETNFFGAVAVTRAFLGLLARGEAANVVNVSSVMGSLSLHAREDGPLAENKPFAYDASKAALNAFTTHLAAALRSRGIRVDSVHPGWARTALGTEAAPMSVEEGARSIVALALEPARTPTGRFVHAGEELPW